MLTCQAEATALTGALQVAAAAAEADAWSELNHSVVSIRDTACRYVGSDPRQCFVVLHVLAYLHLLCVKLRRVSQILQCAATAAPEVSTRRGHCLW